MQLVILYLISDLNNIRLSLVFNYFIVIVISLFILALIPTIMFSFKLYSLYYIINKCISILFTLSIHSSLFYYSFILRLFYIVINVDQLVSKYTMCYELIYYNHLYYKEYYLFIIIVIHYSE